MQDARQRLLRQLMQSTTPEPGGSANAAVARAAVACSDGDGGACAFVAAAVAEMPTNEALRKTVLLLSAGSGDMVRFLGFQCAVIKALDKAVAVARLAADDDYGARDGFRTLLH